MQDSTSESGRAGKAPKEPVSREDVEAVTRLALGAEHRLLDYQVRAYSEERLGFLGCHRRLLVTTRRPGSADTETHSFFVKSMPYEVAEQAAIIQECGAFFKETNFYRQLAPELLRSVADQSWLGRCYLAKDDALLFEDLKSRGFGLRDKFLAGPELRAGLTGLARLHGATILAERGLGRSFAELRPELLRESLFCREGRWLDWFRSSVDVLLGVARHLRLDDSRLAEFCEGVFDKLGPSAKWRNVLCHGDAKSYNLMFDESEPLPKCVLVDFQLLRYAPASTDLLQFLYLTTRRGEREASERELLVHYHGALCETLGEGSEHPGLSEIIEEYEETRLVGVVTAALYFPIMLLEGKRCADMTKDSDGFARLLFEDKLELVLGTMRCDSEYRDVIEEILTEMVEKSEQLLAR